MSLFTAKGRFAAAGKYLWRIDWDDRFVFSELSKIGAQVFSKPLAIDGLSVDETHTEILEGRNAR